MGLVLEQHPVGNSAFVGTYGTFSPHVAVYAEINVSPLRWEKMFLIRVELIIACMTCYDMHNL